MYTTTQQSCFFKGLVAADFLQLLHLLPQFFTNSSIICTTFIPLLLFNLLLVLLVSHCWPLQLCLFHIAGLCSWTPENAGSFLYTVFGLSMLKVGTLQVCFILLCPVTVLVTWRCIETQRKLAKFVIGIEIVKKLCSLYFEQVQITGQLTNTTYQWCYISINLSYRLYI